MGKSPIFKKNQKIIHGKYIDNKGTGVVHISPAHGIEDFLLTKKNKLFVYNIINKKGKMKTHIKPTNKQTISTSNIIIIKKLINKQTIVCVELQNNKKACCWRHKIFLYFRSTKQWFI